MKLCKLCQSEMEAGVFDYCEKCRMEWKSPKDRAYYLKKGQSAEYKRIASDRAAKWNNDNYERFTTRQKQWKEKLCHDTLLFYSNSDAPKCVCCGEPNINVLSLDHIHNDGKKDRFHTASFYRKALKLQDKTQYQTLCYNCNWKKHLANLKSKWKYKKMNIRLRRISNARKLTCIAHYSNNENKCCKCGNHDMEVLCLDHINNDGNVHRKELNGGINKGGASFYRWLIKNLFPSQLQVLCLNCNINKQRM